MIEQLDTAPGLGEFVDDYHLIGVMPRQAIRGEDQDHVVGTFCHQIAQAISGRAVQPCSTVAFIPKDIRFGHLVAALLTGLA
jgi:hypothetical protein